MLRVYTRIFKNLISRQSCSVVIYIKISATNKYRAKILKHLKHCLLYKWKSIFLASRYTCLFINYSQALGIIISQSKLPGENAGDIYTEPVFGTPGTHYCSMAIETLWILIVVFQATIVHRKAKLGRRQPGRMR